MKTIQLIACLLCSVTVLISQENAEIVGGITVGQASSSTPAEGTIQFNGSTFEGYTSNGWQEFGGSFDPEIVTTYEIQEIVIDSLGPGESYIVPDGYNLYITDFKTSGTTTIKEGLDEVEFSAFSSFFENHIQLALGEGMSVSNASNSFTFNGFLSSTKVDFIVKTLPYTVPDGKTLYITSYRQNFSTPMKIDGIIFNGVRVGFSNQVIGGLGSIIGYLK